MCADVNSVVGGMSRAALPLSGQQEYVIHLESLIGGRAAALWAAVPLPAAVSHPELSARMEELLQEHELLRASLSSSPDAYWQEARQLPACERVAASPGRAASALQEFCSAPFDRASGPLWRLAAADVDQASRLLVVAVDPLMADGLSLSLLLRRLVNSGSSRGTPSATYRDYVSGQQAQLTDTSAGRHLDYWRAQLNGIPVDRSSLRNLCRAVPDENVDEFGTARRSVVVEGTLQRELAAVARRHETTEFAVLVALLIVQVAKMTGDEDISARVTIHGRQPKFAWTVGLFADAVPIRVQNAHSPRTAVPAVAAALRGAARNHLPYIHLLRLLGSEGHRQWHTPLELAITSPAAALAVNGAADIRKVSRRASGRPIGGWEVEIVSNRGYTTLHLRFDRQRFTGATVDAYLAGFCEALADVTTTVA